MSSPRLQIPLWPEGVPGQKNIGLERNVNGCIFGVSEPTLTVYPAEATRANGTAVIVIPGGGYAYISMEREGIQYARWLSSLGVTVFVLKYRLCDYGHPAPLQDVLRAVRLVRSRAEVFQIDPNRIGVMGSSAGGHLAASAGTLFDDPAGKTDSPLDDVSARPDFLILMYPVVTLESPNAHAGSRTALLGEQEPPELIASLSLERRVSSATPPTLLIHTQEDAAVPIENSLLFFQALTRAQVPAELYAYERGVHGMGMTPGLGTSSDWPIRCEEWLRGRGLLPVRSAK